MGTKKKLRIIFMGMGCSGINFAYQLFKRMENVELIIYEKNPEIGGTWYENKYPGCACDIPSVAYQFTWAPKPDWSQYYSGSAEIHQYFRQVAEENNLLKYVKLNHKIVRAEWEDGRGQWKVTVSRNNDPADTFEDYGEIFLNGGGVLNKWRWPEIKGLHSFKGKLMHSANYDNTVDLKGKKVLNIGVGSSGVQIVPQIINEVDQLYVVARSPVWITNGFAPTFAGKKGANFHYSADIQQRFKNDPEYYLKYRKAIESELNVRFKFILNDTPPAIEAREFSYKEMSTKLGGRKDLIDNLIPKDFNVGCRRPTPGNGFLEALTQDKTHIIYGELQEITETGFTDSSGVHHEVDVIICATGFDTSFKPAFPVLFDGQNLQDQFNKEIIGYLGLSSPEVPNYWVFIGAYGPLGHGSVLPMVEFYTRYFLDMIEKIQVEDIKRVSVKRSAAEDFTHYADEYLKRTAWSGPCSSWFRNGKTNNKPVLWPGSRVHYLTVLEKPRIEDYDIKYWHGNSFSFLGNGFATRELDGRDITWYMGLLDERDVQPKQFQLDQEDGSGVKRCVDMNGY